MEDLISKKEAAQVLGVSEKTFLRRVHDGLFRSVKFSDRIIKYPKSEIEAYIARQRAGMQPDITPIEAERVVRGVLEAYHFDEDTASSLEKVADYLATLYRKEGKHE